MKTFTTLFLSAVLLISFSAGAQYCMLPGRTPYSNIQPGIINFKLNTINRTSAAVENMNAVVVETGDTTTLLRGHTYTVTIAHTRDSVLFPTVRNNIRVWLDYNKNWKYTDTGETVISADLQTYGIFTANFTVPANAPLGSTMLRATVKMSADGGHTLPSACDSPADPIGYHGEMEDYKVVIAAPASVNEINLDHVNVSLSPNPVKDQVFVSLDAIDSKPLSVNLYDLSGRRIAQLLSEPVQSSLSYKFHLGAYAAGMYFIKITSGDISVSQKLIKVN